MTAQRWLLGSVLVSAAVLLTACGGESPAPTQPPAPTSPASSSSAASGDWTKVTTQPKTVEGTFRTAPCEILPAAQLSGLGLPDKPKPAAASCAWSNHSNSRAEVRVELYRDTLLKKFGAEAPKAGSGLEVGKVAGYPSVRSLDGADQRGCMVFTAISDTETLRSYFTSYKTMPAVTPDACGFAEKVLSAVIEKLPAKT
ncbi:DUF3558 family protein [Crossiella sp. CA-258035]|uniref:DUF3558 family protein n=1 Tax=Crossiella sp. CA-258035 TaxID=2981138 RepID=UPI0024BD32C7|nr:DUF3558 family protein [Crossiella sp. CA-258035]WHT18335.1 DUF3558 family protein [Crossiella sp. CA-258035]